MEKSERAPDSEWCRNHIWNTTGFVPAVYDNGTHYITNMTLEALKTTGF
ncbi:MAG: hypothetical protein JO297_10810 [Nitrososphaeraceae archaeon]|nr:hypothetical protein [Nitrososphaeraceae archaeon]